LEVDGTELGDLEELKGNAGEKAVEVRNYRRRRLSFYFMQRHMALLFFVFDILDPSLAAKGFDLLVHDWSEDRLTEVTAHKRAAVLWKLLLEILNRGAAQQQENHPRLPLLEFLAYSTSRPLWQKDNIGASTERFLEASRSAAAILRKSLKVDLNSKVLADLTWGHLRTIDRNLLKTRTYTSGPHQLPIKGDMTQLLTAVSAGTPGAEREQYFDRDSGEEEKLLAMWLKGPVGGAVLAYWSRLAGTQDRRPQHHQVQPDDTTTKRPRPERTVLHKTIKALCGKCGRMATHRAAECEGKDWKPSQAKSSTKEGKDALSQASSSGPRKDPRGRAADHQKTGKSSQKRRCYNCWDEGHVLPQCQLPRANPLPF